MAVVLRLMRFGKRSKPFYRIIAIDKRKKRDGAYLDQIGYFDPISNPENLKVDLKKYIAWIKKGAQISEGLGKIVKSKKFKALFQETKKQVQKAKE